MESVNINILSKFKGKYLYKCLRLIVFWVIIPLIIIILLIFIFYTNELISILEII